jgi:hypothetical protein
MATKLGFSAFSNLAEIDMTYASTDTHTPSLFPLPTLNSRYEKYVRSEPSDTVNENLLRLPRELNAYFDSWPVVIIKASETGESRQERPKGGILAI